MFNHARTLSASALCTLAMLTPFPLAAQDAAAPSQNEAALTASVAGADDAELGNVSVQPTASGQMLVKLDLKSVPAGVHAVHVHETGDCGSDDFKSAGGHLAGEMQHGVMDAGGPHPGDLPDIHVPDSGELMVEYFAPALTAEAMMDDDGSAFVIHAKADDYQSQPAGDAGDRIGCGVFQQGN